MRITVLLILAILAISCRFANNLSAKKFESQLSLEWRIDFQTGFMTNDVIDFYVDSIMVLNDYNIRGLMDEFSGLSLTRFSDRSDENLGYIELNDKGLKEVIKMPINHDKYLNITLKLMSKHGNIPDAELVIDLMKGRFIGINRLFSKDENLSVYQMDKHFNYH